MTRKISTRGRRIKRAPRAKVKEVFFKVLPWSAVAFLILAMTGIGLWLDKPSNPVQAAPAQGTIGGINLYDKNGNGKIDEIRLSIGNGNGATWTVGTAGSAVTQGGNPVTIDSMSIEGAANDNPVTVLINLHEADMIVDTDCVSPDDVAGQIEYSYSGAVGIHGGGIDDGVEELASVSSGDSGKGSADTELDSAAPVIKSITYRDEDGDGLIDHLLLNYSETVSGSSVLSDNDLWVWNGGDFSLTIDSDPTNLITGSTDATDVRVSTGGGGVCLGCAQARITADTHDDSGSLSIATQNAFSLTDSTGKNTNTTLGEQSQAAYLDGAAPVIANIAYEDQDGDGKIDHMKLGYTETVTAASHVSANDLIFTGGKGGTPGEAVGDFTGMAFGDNTDNLIVAPTDSTDVTLGTEATVVDTADSGTYTGDALAISTQNAFTLSDPYGNTDSTQGAQTWVNFVDNAAPVLVSTSPANGTRDVAVDEPIVWSFSEPMDETEFTSPTEFTSLPDASAWYAATWSDDGQSVTMAHRNYPGGTLVDIMTNDTAIFSGAGGKVRPPFFITLLVHMAGPGQIGPGPVKGAGLPLNVSGTPPVPANFSFSTAAAATGGSTPGSTIVTPTSITLTAPNGGEALPGGEPYDVKWSSAGTTISKVKLSYSLDSGINFPNVIAADEANDGTYSWTVPNISSRAVKVMIEGYDSSGAFVASDISNADFAITYNETEGETPSEEANENVPSNAEVPPITPASSLQPGDVFKSTLSSAVYYLGSDNKRHIFPDVATYKSWYPDFSGVKNISDSDVRVISPGQNVTIRPGTVLVKITTDARVYAVEPGGVLRWIPNEARAATLYGAAWRERLLTFLPRFLGRLHLWH